jgi:hypothetical protein
MKKIFIFSGELKNTGTVVRFDGDASSHQIQQNKGLSCSVFLKDHESRPGFSK